MADHHYQQAVFSINANKLVSSIKQLELEDKAMLTNILIIILITNLITTMVILSFTKN